MSRIPMRLRAFAMTSLAAVVLMTGTEAAFAADPLAIPDPSAASVVDPAKAADPATILDASTTTTSVDVPPTSAAPTTTDTTTGALSGATATTVDAPPVAPAPAPAVAARVQVAAVVVAFARSHLRAAYRHFGTGPSSFDCSGLMWRVFKEAGLGRKVSSRSARGIYMAYRARGLASRTAPQVGDLIVWGRGSHVGVYIGQGYAISALVQGVRVHRVRAMFTPFTAYLHTHLSDVSVAAWHLVLATHARSVRHATRTTFLRAAASGSAASLGRIRAGVRFVVLARHRGAAGRLWLRVLTFRGVTGWLPASATAR